LRSRRHEKNPCPTARIKALGQFASIGHEAFEAIADVPLYQDVPWSASRVPPLTLRTHLDSMGQRPDQRGRVYFLSGLVERVASLLDDRDWQVTLLGAPQMQYFSRSMPLRSAIAQADARPNTLVQLPKPSERLLELAALRRQFPDVHVLIITKNKSAARSLARKLRQATGQPVTWGIEPRSYPWTHVDSVGTFTGRSVQDWFFVIFWEAELVLSLTSLSQIVHMFGSARIGFLTRDERKLNQIDRAIVESVFGPVLYRPGDEHGESTDISVSWLPAPSYPACQPDSQLDRKREYLWRNAQRNNSIAAAARAIIENDRRTLARLGLDDAVQWLCGNESGLVRVSAKPLTVAIVVENLEHARELELLLPGWPLWSENNFADPVPLINGNAILTLPLAARITLLFDLVIYAAGSGEAWFDELGLGCIGITSERMLLVDVADDFDRQAAWEAEARRADYRRRGWITTTTKTRTLCGELEQEPEPTETGDSSGKRLRTRT
jgi:hypothetical protein